MSFLKLTVWNFGKFDTGFVSTNGIRSILVARSEGGEKCAIIRYDSGDYVVCKGTPEEIAAIRNGETLP